MQYARLKKRLEEVTALDFFSAPERGAAEGALAQLASSFAEAEPERARKPVGQLRGKTWVTRKGVFIDRIACAWVIRRHIDNQAGFKFTADPKYRPKRDELRFDMFDGEFTHRQGKCSFENMLEEFQLDDPAMLAVSEIIHDIDLKEDRFGRPETAGIHSLFSGLAAAHEKDEERLERGSAILEDLYTYFSRQPKEKPGLAKPRNRKREKEE